MKKSVQDHWTEEVSGEIVPHWRVHYMATEPELQGKGYGGEILQWGLQQADMDGLPVGVDASRIGLKLYHKNGFKTVGEVTLGDTIGYICKKGARNI